MNIKLVIPLVVLIILGATIPFAWQNASDYGAVNKNVENSFKTIDQICDSGCTNYPKEWVKKGSEKEAQNYCLKQCTDRPNMKINIERDIVNGFKYRSEIHKNIGFAYCLLGLNCLSKSY